jgi:hypothetical protein
MVEVHVLHHYEVIAKFKYKNGFDHTNIREITVKGKMYSVVAKELEFTEDAVIVKIHV